MNVRTAVAASLVLLLVPATAFAECPATVPD